jgi:hypothetical protein
LPGRFPHPGNPVVPGVKNGFLQAVSCTGRRVAKCGPPFYPQYASISVVLPLNGGLIEGNWSTRFFFNQDCGSGTPIVISHSTAISKKLRALLQRFQDCVVTGTETAALPDLHLPRRFIKKTDDAFKF